MPYPSPLRRFIWIVFVSVLIGAFYADLRYSAPGTGAIVAGSMGAALFSLDRFVLRRNAGGLFPRLPFLPYLALRTCLYAAVVIIINGIANLVATAFGVHAAPTDTLKTLYLISALPERNPDRGKAGRRQHAHSSRRSPRPFAANGEVALGAR
jgi:hypothetical protein